MTTCRLYEYCSEESARMIQFVCDYPSAHFSKLPVSLTSEWRGCWSKFLCAPYLDVCLSKRFYHLKPGGDNNLLTDTQKNTLIVNKRLGP